MVPEAALVSTDKLTSRKYGEFKKLESIELSIANGYSIEDSDIKTRSARYVCYKSVLELLNSLRK